MRLLLAALAGKVLCLVRGADVLGAAPEDQSRYSGGEFKCFDGKGGPLPATAINDEFCDCADGSDEPGTGACAGQTTTVFYCRNEGSTPRRVYASRVGDGICDCCDGSDEASLAARLGKVACVNTCAEQGRLEAEANKRRIEELTRALQLKEENRKKALVERDGYADEIKKLESERPALEEELKALKVDADKEREEKKKREEAERAAKDADSKAWDDEACRWRQTGGCDPHGEREAHNDKKCNEHIAKGSSGYCDCNGNEKQDEAEGEPGFTCSSDGPGTCGAACPKVDKGMENAKPGQDATGAQPQEEKPQVSEYTKWMEGAADKMSEDGEKAVEGDKPQVSEYTKWMDGAESKIKEEAEGEAKPAPESTATTTTTEPAKQSAIDQEQEAERKLSSNKDRAKEIQDKTDAITDGHFGYSSLVGKTLTARVAEFNYKISFFTSATQDSTNLGKWDKWTGPRSGSFEKGTMCWGGPERKLNVNFECGETAALIDAFEPSRCVYEATVVHPGACEEADLQALIAGTRVIAVHEEL